MKTKADKTIPSVIIGYGLIFILPLVISANFRLTIPGVLWCAYWSVFILYGLWKIESYELMENQLIKFNFIGLFKREVDLTTLVHYNIKFLNTDFMSNPLNVVRFFSKDIKYLKYRKVILEFEQGSKLKLDERIMNITDFNKLLGKIKGFKGKKR